MLRCTCLTSSIPASYHVLTPRGWYIRDPRSPTAKDARSSRSVKGQADAVKTAIEGFKFDENGLLAQEMKREGFHATRVISSMWSHDLNTRRCTTHYALRITLAFRERPGKRCGLLCNHSVCHAFLAVPVLLSNASHTSSRSVVMPDLVILRKDEPLLHHSSQTMVYCSQRRSTAPLDRIVERLDLLGDLGAQIRARTVAIVEAHRLRHDDITWELDC